MLKPYNSEIKDIAVIFANIDDKNSKYFKVLQTIFGYDTFLPLQEKIIAHILEKKDALVVMPTGAANPYVISSRQ